VNSLRGDRLREIREAQGLSQHDLSILCHFGVTMIYRYENGLSDPTVKALKRLSEVLGVSGDYLMGLSNDQRGQLGDSNLSEDERDVLEHFRHEGWAGIARLGLEKLIKQVG